MAKRSKKYTRYSTRIERNIHAIWNAATVEERDNGLAWYQRAHEHAVALGLRHGYSTRTVAGVIAAISPGSDWGQNLANAEALLIAHAAGDDLPLVGTYGWRNVYKARAILDGADPLEQLHAKTGPKTRAFFVNIAEPRNAEGGITVDRHAKCLALGIWNNRGSDSNATVRAGREYEYYARHYRVLAERLGVLPHQLQAVTWVAWRRLVAAKEDEIPF